MGQPGVRQPSMGQPSVRWLGMTQSGRGQPSVGQSSLGHPEWDIWCRTACVGQPGMSTVANAK